MNKFGLSFDPLFPIGWIFGVVVATLAFLLWFEFRKKQKWIVYRFVALLLITISVLGLVLQPSISSVQRPGAIFLTAGYDPLKVDSVLKLNPDLKIIRTSSADPFANSVEIASRNLFREDVNYVFGEGLPQYDLDQSIRSNFIFFPARLESGVNELTVPEIFSGRRNSVLGRFNAERKTKLTLVGPAGPVDSTFVDKEKKTFVFSFIPKQPGLFIYSVVSEDSLGAKTSERLPIEVKPGTKLRVLFLQDFPSAEFRHLKNFLAEHGHSIVVRTRTSKDNFTEEFVNSPRVQLNKVTTDFLSDFDLLLTDSKTIERLPMIEKSNLEQAVRMGLGLMVAQQQPLKKNEFYSISCKGIPVDTAHFRMNNKSYVLPACPIEIKMESEIKAVIENKKRVLAGYRFFGAGKIGFQLLQETFRMKQEGDSVDYATIWSALAERIARKKISDFELKMDTHFPLYTDEPATISVISAGKPAMVFSDNIEVPLSEDVIIDDYWHGNIWAGAPGWHQLRLADSTTHNYFVHSHSEWKTLRGAYSAQQTKAAQDRSLLKKKYSMNAHQPVPRILFFLTFLFAGAFLWVAAKI